MPLTAPTKEGIAAAARLLRAGRLVAFPTETVYGLGADATNPAAVLAIYEAKGRPRFNPLIAHVADVSAARALVRMTPIGEALAAAFWPGPLTLVLEMQPDCPVCDLVTAGLTTLAVRVPAHPVAQALLKAAAVPVAAPSANRSGRVSPTWAEHVTGELGRACAMVLDGGPTDVGLESTIVGASGPAPALLRAGAVTRQDITRVTGLSVASGGQDPSAPTAPGQLLSHYAPRARVRLNAHEVRPGEALLAFGEVGEKLMQELGGPSAALSRSGDLREAAMNLFAALRALDAAGVQSIAVTPIPDEGLGEAINDRLRRAAAPR